MTIYTGKKPTIYELEDILGRKGGGDSIAINLDGSITTVKNPIKLDTQTAVTVFTRLLARRDAEVDGLEKEIERLNREVASERDARHKCEDALTRKDEAMGILFERLRTAGVDCSDLIP